MFRGILDAAGIRAQMKERVDELVAATKETNRHIDKLAAAEDRLAAVIENFGNNPNVGELMKLGQEWMKASESARKASETMAQSSSRVVDILGKISKELA